MNLMPKCLVLFSFLIFLTPHLKASECVVLLHGLARTSNSLDKIEEALNSKDYVVANIDYPSRSDTIEKLSVTAVEAGLSACNGAGAEPVSFVTHSMGGILVRFYLETQNIENLHRVVMLAPPNQGSKVVDVYRNVPGYKFLNGPAGLQLGTDEDSVPLQLNPVTFDLGIIAGNKTINLILSQFLENPDDGKVSVANTRVAGMCGFVELPVSHAMMMRNESVIEQIVGYLADGRFSGEGAENGLC